LDPIGIERKQAGQRPVGQQLLGPVEQLAFEVSQVMING